MKTRMFLLCCLLLSFLGCEQQQKSAGNSPSQQQSEGKLDYTFDLGLDSLPADGQPILTKNFYFIFDGSGSMDDRPSSGGTNSKIDEAKRAVNQFLLKVPIDVQLGLYVFDHRGASERLPLGLDRKKFLEEVGNMRPDGNTPLGEAIEFGVDQLVKQRRQQLGYGEFRLIVVTDGQSNGFVSLSHAARYAQKRGIPIYTIGFDIKEDHELRQYSVSYRAAMNGADLARELERTLGEAEDFTPSTFDTSLVK